MIDKGVRIPTKEHNACASKMLKTYVLLHFSPSDLLRLVSYQFHGSMTSSCACIASLSHFCIVLFYFYPCINFTKMARTNTSMLKVKFTVIVFTVVVLYVMLASEVCFGFDICFAFED